MDDKNPLKMKVTELKSELGRRGLSQTGLKFDLAQRLQTAMDVDEFGALPSLTSPSDSSSPLVPVPGKDSTDHSDSPPHSSQTPSCDSTQGGPPAEQAQDLEMAAETIGAEAATQIEQSGLGDASTVVLDTTQSEDTAPPGTEDILTFEEKLGCGKKGHVQNKANSDDIITGIAGDERKLVVDSGGTVEGERGDIGGSNEKTNGVEECGPTASANETPLVIFGSPKNEKDTGEECIPSGDNTVLSSSGSCNGNDGTEEKKPAAVDSRNPESTPASPREGTEHVEEDEDQPGMGAEGLNGETTQESGGKPVDSGQKKTAVQGDLPECDAIQRNQENNGGPSELAPDSLLLSSLAERMKDREERFRQEKKPEAKKGEESEVKDKTGNDNPGPSKASGHDRGSKMDTRCLGIESGKGSVASVGDAASEVQGAQTVEDARRAKLMKRKERFTAPPSASSGNGLSFKSENSSLAKLGTPVADSSSRKVPSGVLGEEASELTSSRRQAASEVAAKMARRSERFGVKAAGSSVPQEAKPAKVRDPRGSVFAESEDKSEDHIEQAASSPTPGGYSFDPLPQREKRARATTTPSYNDDGTPAKRRGVERGVAGALGKTTSSDAVEARSNNTKTAKRTERQNVSFPLASSDGVDEGPLRRKEAGKPSPSSSSVKRMCSDSTFALLGVKKIAPKLSMATTAAAGKGKGAPPTRLGRGRGEEMVGAPTHPPECLDKEGKAKKKSQQRDGQSGTAPSQDPLRPPCGEEQAEKKFAEQAAKMAERRKRFAEDPRAPSFR